MTVQSVLVAFAVVVLAGTGCMSASRHAEDVQQGLEGDKLTVGTVQREIRQGMSGAEVVEVLPPAKTAYRTDRDSCKTTKRS